MPKPGGKSGCFWGRVGGVGGLLEGVGSKPKCREPATRGGFVSWPTAEQQMLFNIQAKRLCASQQQQQEQQQHWQHSNSTAATSTAQLNHSSNLGNVQQVTGQ